MIWPKKRFYFFIIFRVRFLGLKWRDIFEWYQCRHEYSVLRGKKVSVKMVALDLDLNFVIPASYSDAKFYFRFENNPWGGEVKQTRSFFSKKTTRTHIFPLQNCPVFYFCVKNDAHIVAVHQLLVRLRLLARAVRQPRRRKDKPPGRWRRHGAGLLHWGQWQSLML